MDSKKILGQSIRKHRRKLALSQERLAEKADITYQYLSSLENGQENFSIGVLDNLATALGLTFPSLVSDAYTLASTEAEYPKLADKYFRNVPLPSGLTMEHLKDALNETHRIVRLLNQSLIKSGGRALPSYIQANNFSGIVSNVLSDSFDRMTPYKHNHDQRYPDLKYISPTGEMGEGLEVKSTIQVGKGGESHNGHSGWHIVACFKIDKSNGDILFTHIMFADLIGYTEEDSDWKYVGSKVDADSGSQRTETYSTTGIGTTKLRDGSAYLDQREIEYKRWRPNHPNGIPEYSIFYEEEKE